MTKLIVVILLIGIDTCYAQPATYSTANAHSHNNYEQPVPFHSAWQNEFGSIEADIFLHKGQLIVAHDSAQLLRLRTLDSLYLQPLQQCIRKNNGHVYADRTRQLQLMIDIKSEAAATLRKLVEQIQAYPLLTSCSTLKIVISGNRPPASQFASWPGWIRFDGDLRKSYTTQELQKIEMISDNFARYSHWKGAGPLPEQDRRVLLQLVQRVHQLGKKIRFWNAPDKPESWRCFMELEIDYINTDDIEGLSSFLKNNSLAE